MVCVTEDPGKPQVAPNISVEQFGDLSLNKVSRRMFNNPTFSDIKIRQECQGNVKEYYAHKAVLCSHSEWFLKAFTGNFIEASAPVIELHNDESEPFEFMLRFFYNEYDDLAAERFLDGYDMKTDEFYEKHLLLPIQLDAVGDKYDASPLRLWATRILNDNFKIIGERGGPKDGMCVRLVQAHYAQCLKPSTGVGSLLAGYLTSNHLKFIKNDICAKLIEQFPIFASDILLAIRPRLWKLGK